MTALSRRHLLVLGAAATLAACSTTAKVPVQPKPASSPETLTDAEIITAINGTRAAHGAPPWTYSQQLENAARSQAKLMASKDTLSHDLGVTLRQRVTAAGYLFAVGENVAKGYKTLPSAIDGWLDSSGHRSTLLSTRFVEFGLAAATTSSGKVYWAMIAGGPYEPWMQ